MADDPDGRRFRFILEQRFPEMLDPKYKIGPGRVHLPADVATRYKAVVNEIKSLDAEEFERCYQELHRAHMAKIRAELEAARPYNHPSARPDYEYWGKMPLWSLDEAVALTLDRAPEVATWLTIKLNVDRSALAASFARHRQLYQRGMAAGEIAFPARPADFIGWARGRGVDLPETMSAAVNAILPLEELKEAYDQEAERRRALERELENLKAEIERLRADKGLSQRERSSCLKLIIGMAVKKYRYDPSAPRGPAPTNIADDLHELAIDIDVDTVRKWLKEAAEELRPSQTE